MPDREIIYDTVTEDRVVVFPDRGGEVALVETILTLNGDVLTLDGEVLTI